MQCLASQSRTLVPNSIPSSVGGHSIPVTSVPELQTRFSRQLSASPKAASPVWATPEAFTHDARNLLTALGLYADLLKAPGVLSQRHQHYASELRLLADRSSALLGYALTPSSEPGSSPSEAGSPVSSPGQAQLRSDEPLCDAGAVLRRFLPLLQAQAEDAAEVVLRVPRVSPPLPASGQALERITANLVCNAAQAMRSAGAAGGSRGTVWVGLLVRDGAFRLSVEDSGPGMPASAAAMFLRPQTPTPILGEERREARGWGHRIVHALVTETGGRLAVRPRPSGGTVVTVHWPLPSASTLRLYSADREGSADTAAAAC